MLLDITSKHEMTYHEWMSRSTPLANAGSPLALWLSAILSATFKKIELLQQDSAGKDVSLALHDPLCVWYVLGRSVLDWKLASGGSEDIRIETSGQWTRGMCVIDRRNRKRMENEGGAGSIETEVGTEEISGDAGKWLSDGAGNRIRRIVGGLGKKRFSTSLLDMILVE